MSSESSLQISDAYSLSATLSADQQRVTTDGTYTSKASKVSALYHILGFQYKKYKRAADGECHLLNLEYDVNLRLKRARKDKMKPFIKPLELRREVLNTHISNYYKYLKSLLDTVVLLRDDISELTGYYPNYTRLHNWYLQNKDDANAVYEG